MGQKQVDREDSLALAPESQPSERVSDLPEANLGRWH